VKAITRKQVGLLTGVCAKTAYMMKNAFSDNPDKEEVYDPYMDEDQMLEVHMQSMWKKQDRAIKNWAYIKIKLQLMLVFKHYIHKIDVPDQDFEPEQSWFENGTLILYPHSKVLIVWGLFKSNVLLWSFLSFSYHACFRFNDMERVKGIELGIDILLILDIMITFFTAMLRNECKQQIEEEKDKTDTQYSSSVFEINMKVIANEYLHANLVFDILACLPSMIALERVLWLYPLKLFRLFKVPRMMAFQDMLSKIVVDSNQKRQQDVTNFIRILNTTIILYMSVHMMGCIWIAIGHLHEDQGGVNWIENEEFNLEEDKLIIYWQAIYFITTTVTTVGYGDMSGQTFQERGF